MKRLLTLFGVLTMALVLGCGDSGPADPGGGGDPGGGDPFTGVKSGTWETRLVATATGGDAICSLVPINITDTDVLCAADDLNPTTDEDCEISVDGENFSFDCESLETDEDTGCILRTSIVGTGKFTNTSFTFAGTMSFGPATPGSAECADAFSCSFDMTMTGTWMSVEGADTCGGTAAPTISSLLRQSMAGIE